MSHHAPHPEPTVDVDQHAPQKAQERRSWALLVVTLAAQILVVLRGRLPAVGAFGSFPATRGAVGELRCQLAGGIDLGQQIVVDGRHERVESVGG